jgi:hypothetical protein
MPHKKGYFSARAGKDSKQVIQAGVLLTLVLCACNFAANIPAATTEPDMTSWHKIESPLFPTNWTPTADTVWVSYTFAYGSNPTKLMDGAYVTLPLSKTEWQGGKSTTTELSGEMKQASVQGVTPLDEQASVPLEKGKQVSAYCLTLTGLPNLATSETKEMLAYYKFWFKYNGAFLDLIRKDHTDFIDWVLKQP